MKIEACLTLLLISKCFDASQAPITNETLTSLSSHLNDDLRRGDIESAQLRCIQLQSGLVLMAAEDETSSTKAQFHNDFTKVLSARPLGSLKTDPEVTAPFLTTEADLYQDIIGSDSEKTKMLLGRLTASLADMRTRQGRLALASYRDSASDLNDYLASSTELFQAMRSGDYVAAESFARLVLSRLETYKQSPSLYGGNFYACYDALGRAALRRGDLALAGEYLLQSAQTPGSVILRIDGPNMWLAKALLDRGLNSVVIQYLKKCERFWPKPVLQRWLAKISTNEANVTLLPNSAASFGY